MKNVIILFLIYCCISLCDSLKVAAVYPASQSLYASINTEIKITFNKSINPFSISDTSFMIFGRWSGPAVGSISFNEDSSQIIFTPVNKFSSGEIVTVSLSKNIKELSGENLSKGFTYNFWIGTSLGTMDLVRKKTVNVRRNGESWIQTYGAYAGDLNRDGFTDFLVPNENANDVRVFLNDGKGDYPAFNVFPMPGGSRPSTNEGSDFNLDGNMDFAVGNSTNDQVTVFLGDGNGGFFSIKNYAASTQVRGLSIMDVEGDGFMDIVTANRVGSNVTILRNKNDATFELPQYINLPGDGETACASADVNNDGIMDLFVGALYSKEVILLLGDGEGGLEFKSEISIPGSPWMVASGDMNGDGIPDVLSANSNTNNISIIFSDSLGNLTEPVNYSTGSFPLSIDVGDLDGDGDLDVITSNFTSANYTLYENDGTGNLINKRTLPANSAGSCAVFHDRDNDGDLDLTCIDELDDLLILFENNLITTIDEKNMPVSFKLFQNYPNPFNPKTNIGFRISKGGIVSLKVYDLLGKEVAALINKEMNPGEYEVEFDAANIPSGVYFYRIAIRSDEINAGNFSEIKKMVLLK